MDIGALLLCMCVGCGEGALQSKRLLTRCLKSEGRCKMMFLKAIWKFCRYLFVPQRRPKGDEEMFEPLEVVFASGEEYVAPPEPADGFVRLLSPFSHKMYRDVPLDAFCEVDVQTKDLTESNHFLLSLWNEMNKALHPAKCDYVPWYYRPDIVAT